MDVEGILMLEVALIMQSSDSDMGSEPDYSRLPVGINFPYAKPPHVNCSVRLEDVTPQLDNAMNKKKGAIFEID